MKNAFIHFCKKTWASDSVAIMIALYITLMFNRHIYTVINSYSTINTINDYLFIASVYFTVFSMILLLALSLASYHSIKWWGGLLLLISAAIAYICSEYNVIIDEDMIRNMMETDVDEASALLSVQWLAYIMLTGAIPACIISRIRLAKTTWIKAIVCRAISFSLLILLLIANIWPFYSNYASLLRSHRNLKDYIVPTSFLYSGYKYVKNTFPVYQPSIKTMGTDARFATDSKKIVMVIVVGETARAASFSLAGYEKNTNPLLGRRMEHETNMAFFSSFHACGTSTAISVPCLFSAMDRTHFDVNDARYQENLLDVFAHASLEPEWIDNNSGCKGVCARISYSELRNRIDDPSCNKYGCNDNVLVKDLEDKIQSSNKDLVLVLHQRGSHGPAYLEQIPQQYQVYQPVCHSNQLQECTETEIINSYDNTIVYTDYVLDSIIALLNRYANTRDTAMFYVSDHGESLGENNLWLHGMPYQIAPDEQTHIPALLWLSDSFRQRFNIDMACLHAHSQQAYSHDNVFHSLLGLLDISTGIYNERYDFIKPCKTTHGNR